MGCDTCNYFGSESEGEYGSGPQSYYCTKRPNLQNLKTFPFKKELPCYIPDFFFTEFSELLDGTEIAETTAFKLYRKKYFGEIENPAPNKDGV